MHVYGGPGSVAAPFPIPTANAAGYRQVMKRLGLSRVVVVQSMLYANDNTLMLSAMMELGDCARGIAVIDRAASDAEFKNLDSAGVRGVRAFMLDSGPYTWDDLPGLAERLAPFGWCLQVQMDGRELDRRAETLGDLAVPVVIDHVGKFLEPVAVEHPSFAALRHLVAAGRCWVKLSGFYETSRAGPPDYADVSALAAPLIADAPDRMLWGSNWPHPNLRPPPDDLALLGHFVSLVPDPTVRARILVENPARLFGFRPVDRGGDGL
jgi:D-galactarolactone isomerase